MAVVDEILASNTTAHNKTMKPLFPSSTKTSTYPNQSPSHTFSESMMQENIENAETIITKWDDPNNKKPHTENFRSIFQENEVEAKEYVNCVKGLRRAMHFLISKHSDSSSLIQAHKLMRTAMLRLEREFYHILSTNREYLKPESVSKGSSSSLSSENSPRTSSEDDDEERDYIHSTTSDVERAMSHLKMIAEIMMSSGYSKECGKIYRITRRSIIDEEMYRLGIRNHTLSQINKFDQNALENQVDRWLHSLQLAVRTVFNGEKILCDHVFGTSMTMKQACMTHTTMEEAMNLFKFPEIVAKSKRSHEKIVVLMNLFESISNLWPEIESIFSYEQLLPVKLQALSSLHRLSQSVRTILSEYVSSIQKNTSKTSTPGGGVHQLTRSVMSYISILADNSGTLSDILCYESENEVKSPFPESYFESPSQDSTSSVSTRIAWIILVLLCKLNSKAELYKDVGLSYLFLANNLQYVVEKASNGSLKILLGQEWLSKLQNKVKIYAENYQTVAWHKLFQSLEAESSLINTTAFTIQEKLRKINAALEEGYTKQRSWVVPDGKLRDEIKVSMARKIVPGYRELYNTYLSLMNGESDLEVLVKFSPDNLGNYISDLFHGNAISSLSYSSNTQSLMRRRCI